MRERGEFERIDDIVSRLARGEGVIVGPGDDAAVLRPADHRDLVVTTDTFVEGQHFEFERHDAGTIGRRLAAAQLSDIAAMGAAPRWALVSYVAPRSRDAGWLRAVELACAGALEADGAAVVGGNLAASDTLCAWTVALIGEVERGAQWTRAGARAGDVLAASGPLGWAAAALRLGRSSDVVRGRAGAVALALTERWASPPSRIALARALAATGGVRGAIDVSDGLASDLRRFCRESRVGALVRPASFRDDRVLASAARALDLPAVADLAFAPGDDYELLLAIAPEAWDECRAVASATGSPLVELGAFTGGDALEYEREDGGRIEVPGEGWDHFA